MKLTDWAKECGDELGLDVTVERGDVDRILDITRDAAHRVARPAGPVTAYVLGIAVGRGADPAEAAKKLADLTARQQPEQG
ncbi:MAG: molybdopterin-guanine dinucleotide biosynthesis protein [Streptosporangiales bacterium]|nr:molybdopterin-guanine dinucleotide biosynthesis protein [Streptosporangiales bacterium]